MENVTGTGEYTAKNSGEQVTYNFTYVAFDTLDEAIETLGEAKALQTIQRMVKLDANNTAREKAKSANGHSTRPVMSEADKAEAKAKRAQDKALLDRIKALSPEDRAALGL